MWRRHSWRSPTICGDRAGPSGAVGDGASTDLTDRRRQRAVADREAGRGRGAQCCATRHVRRIRCDRREHDRLCERGRPEDPGHLVVVPRRPVTPPSSEPSRTQVDQRVVLPLGLKAAVRSARQIASQYLPAGSVTAVGSLNYVRLTIRGAPSRSSTARARSWCWARSRRAGHRRPREPRRSAIRALVVLRRQPA